MSPDKNLRAIDPLAPVSHEPWPLMPPAARGLALGAQLLDIISRLINVVASDFYCIRAVFHTGYNDFYHISKLDLFTEKNKC